VKKSFNIQELLHSKSKRHETKADAPLLQSFPKRARTRSEASQFSGFHKYKTNKLPCFIDRCFSGLFFDFKKIENCGYTPKLIL
jgi:hypothetical protein